MFRIRREQLGALAKARARESLESRLEPLRERGFSAVIDPISSEISLRGRAGEEVRILPQVDCTSVLTKEGRTFCFEHGDRCRLAAMTEPGGLRLNFEHDSRGRLTAVSRGQHGAFGRHYDERGLLASLVYPDRTEVRYVYGQHGKLATVIDRNGCQRRYDFTETGEIAKVIDGRGGEIAFEYNGWTLPSTIQLPNGDRQTFDYDEQGRPKEICINGNAHATFQYDDNQNAQCIEYADHTFARFATAGGRIVEAANEFCKVKLAYDDHGRLVREDTDGTVVQYLRNGNGLLVGIVTPDGEKITFERDGDQNVRQITDWAGGRYTIDYEPSGAVSEIAYPNGARLRQRSTSLGLVESLQVFASRRADSSIATCNWTHDICDRVTSYTRDGTRQAYRYDNEGRLLEVVASDPGFSAVFELDANGNRTKDCGVECAINELNQLTEKGGHKFFYDALGNMVSGPCPKGSATYHYNGRGLMTSIHSASGETNYEYDAFGRRVLKRSAGSVTRYIWAGQQLLSEVTTTNGKSVRREYLFFPERPYPIAMRADGSVYYIHPGRLGEPLCMTDDKSEVVWRAQYSAFGSAKVSLEEIGQPWRLPGQYFDEETGLHYALMRYYNPDLGRYLTLDPMRVEGGSLNFYTYCDGDPLNRYDPTGGLIIPAILIAAAVGAVIGAAIGAAVEAYRQHKEYGEIKDGWAVAKAAGVGAVIGAIGGAVGAAVEIAAAGAMAAAAAGALSGGIGAAVEYCAEVAFTDATWDWGMLALSVGVGTGTGAVTAGVGGWVAARAARKAAASAAKELEEQALREASEKAARDSIKTSAKNPDVIALGLSTCREKVTLPDGRVIEAVRDNVLGDFAKNVDGSGKSAATWTKFDPVVDPESGLTDMGATIRNAMKDAKEIHFNREGMTNFDEIAKNPDPGLYKPPSTNWELATILSDPALKSKTKFYNGPGSVE